MSDCIHVYQPKIKIMRVRVKKKGARKYEVLPPKFKCRFSAFSNLGVAMATGQYKRGDVLGFEGGNGNPEPIFLGEMICP